THPVFCAPEICDHGPRARCFGQGAASHAPGPILDSPSAPSEAGTSASSARIHTRTSTRTLMFATRLCLCSSIMIAFLEGTLVEAMPTHAIIDVNGVGYQVSIPLSSYDKLP